MPSTDYEFALPSSVRASEWLVGSLTYPQPPGISGVRDTSSKCRAALVPDGDVRHEGRASATGSMERSTAQHLNGPCASRHLGPAQGLEQAKPWRNLDTEWVVSNLALHLKAGSDALRTDEELSATGAGASSASSNKQRKPRSAVTSSSGTKVVGCLLVITAEGSASRLRAARLVLERVPSEPLSTLAANPMATTTGVCSRTSGSI